MTYEQFKHRIHVTLRESPGGMTWSQLRDRLGLPYDRPCPDWTRRLENEIGLIRRKGTTKAFVWSCVPRRKEKPRLKDTHSMDIKSL